MYWLIINCKYQTISMHNKMYSFLKTNGATLPRKLATHTEVCTPWVRIRLL